MTEDENKFFNVLHGDRRSEHTTTKQQKDHKEREIEIKTARGCPEVIHGGAVDLSCDIHVSLGMSFSQPLERSAPYPRTCTCHIEKQKQNRHKGKNKDKTKTRTKTKTKTKQKRKRKRKRKQQQQQQQLSLSLALSTSSTPQHTPSAGIPTTRDGW